MGKGFSFRCKNCQKEYSVLLGYGFGYPREYKSRIDEIASGKYGKEMQSMLEDNPYLAVNAGTVLYVCNNCAYWETGKDLSLYSPKDTETVLKTKYGEKTVEELGYIPYVMEWDLKDDYHIVKRYYHRCPECGKRMKKFFDPDTVNLKCPKCGLINEPIDEMRWD